MTPNLIRRASIAILLASGVAGLAAAQPPGTPDPGFGLSGGVRYAFDFGGSNWSDWLRALAVGADDRILVAGAFATTANSLDLAVARVTSDARFADGFDVGGMPAGASAAWSSRFN